MPTDDDDNQITIHSVTITPDMVDAEAKRFAMRSGGILLMAMAEKNITEDQLAHMLNVPKRQIRQLLLGERHQAYLPLAALCLALGIRMDLRTNMT
jgi:plasmid maintenance system antidote protein VapI